MMKAIYVDDERSAHINFQYDLKDRVEIDSLNCFFKSSDALEFARKNPIDCAFLDIELGGGDCGLNLATNLKTIQPNIEVVFVTAYNQYARDSYRVGGRTYLTKPYSQEELDESLFILQKLTNAHRLENELSTRPQTHVQMKTFGNFDLVVDGQPVAFKNSKAKELLAYLVHQRGGTVNSAQVFLALWERQEYTSTTSTYVRRTARALREELETRGLGDILINRRNCYSVDINRFICDYYEVLSDSKKAAHLYNEEYMSQYSWGEGTIPLLQRKVDALEQQG